jgi:ribose transport system ATP-binding protein
MAAGVALLPGDRQGASGAGGLSVKENVTLPTVERFFVRGLLRPVREQARVVDVLRTFDVRPVAPARKLETLSGGNQQKALVAKWLERRPRIFLMHEPTQGVDVSAREEIAGVIAQIASAGGSVLLCSCEYEDLARICGRVLVFRHGRITSELEGDGLTKDRIIERCYTTERVA